MAEKRDGLDSVRLDEGAARRLIERATGLDAKLASESSIADLRDAAREAGISDSEGAVPAAPSTPPVPPPPR